MQQYVGIITFIILLGCSYRTHAVDAITFPADTVPADLKGKFTDDYGIRYEISDSLWTQLPKIRYHILQWNVKDQFIIARNDAANPSDTGLYTRIDYMRFENMEPWRWGFCLTVYNARATTVAETTAPADRQNPGKGCNGFPFSRMKKEE